MPLLGEDALARLNKFQLMAKSIVEGFLVGLHKSPYHGFSVEFSDHRQYNPGESLRDLDWKVAARTEQYWCPIKHARQLKNVHSRYGKFVEFGDSDAYREQHRDLRRDFSDLDS